MKQVKVLMTVASLAMAWSVAAQQDFSGPQYAAWGDTPEERLKNIEHSNYLKDAVDQKKYDEAAEHFRALLKNCPGASEGTFMRGTTIYNNKVARAKSLAEKKMYLDSLMLVYDLRVQYFGDHAKRGKVYILDRKAKDYFRFNPSDRDGVRRYFKEAVDAAIAENGAADPELMVVYFKNMCDDYQVDLVTGEDILAEYERLSPLFDNISADKAELKDQFDTLFGTSGVATCENLTELFGAKLAADPENRKLLSQAVSLMSRMNCTNDFFFATAEKYYEVEPSAETALSLANIFQQEKDFGKATKYLQEALAVETEPAKREELLVRISMVELAAQHYAASAAAARQARDINPENPYAYFVMAQCYAATATACSGLVGDAFWAAYDYMDKAASLFGDDAEMVESANNFKRSYRSGFPTTEECFFNELKEGQAYVVKCGVAAGVSTVVRYRD